MRTFTAVFSLLTVATVSLLVKPSILTKATAPVQNPDSLKQAEDSAERADSLREQISALRVVLAEYRRDSVSDTTSHRGFGPMVAACSFAQLQNKLVTTAGHLGTFSIKLVPVSLDTLRDYIRKVSWRIAWELRKVFDLSREERQGEEKCSQFQFHDGIVVMESLLHNLNLAHIPFDSAYSAELRGLLVKDLQADVKEIRKETPEYVNRDPKVIKAVCGLKIPPEYLGLRMYEIPQCPSVPGTSPDSLPPRIVPQ